MPYTRKLVWKKELKSIPPPKPKSNRCSWCGNHFKEATGYDVVGDPICQECWTWSERHNQLHKIRDSNGMIVL